MPDDDVAARLKLVLRETVGLSEVSLQRDGVALFSARGGRDSVSLLRLVMALEKQFGIVIDDDDIHADNFASLSALIAFVERKLG